MRRVYFDNNASTPVLLKCSTQCAHILWSVSVTPRPFTITGRILAAAVEHARESVAALLAARASEIVFTSGGTEGDNLGVLGLVRRRRSRHHLDHQNITRY